MTLTCTHEYHQVCISKSNLNAKYEDRNSDSFEVTGTMVNQYALKSFGVCGGGGGIKVSTRSTLAKTFCVLNDLTTS